MLQEPSGSIFQSYPSARPSRKSRCSAPVRYQPRPTTPSPNPEGTSVQMSQSPTVRFHRGSLSTPEC